MGITTAGRASATAIGERILQSSKQLAGASPCGKRHRRISLFELVRDRYFVAPPALPPDAPPAPDAPECPPPPVVVPPFLPAPVLPPPFPCAPLAAPAVPFACAAPPLPPVAGWP